MWYVAQVQAGRESATRDLCLRLASPDVLEECFMPEYETMWRVRGGNVQFFAHFDSRIASR